MIKNFSKKQALSFAEIVVIIFIIIAMLCILFAKLFGVKQESSIIYNWKKTLNATEYSYNVLLLTHKDELEKLMKLDDESKNEKILNLFKTTLNVNTIDTVNAKKSLKRYKYRFLNGRQVPKDSKYYIKNFIYSPDGKIMAGLNWFNNDCFNNDGLCGVLLFDMNGVKLPNRFGLDIFGANIYKDKIEPFGSGLSYEENQLNCRRLETGVTCSKFYLMGGQFFK